MITTPQNKGYQLFFTNSEKSIVAMQYARASAKANRFRSNLYADYLIKNDYFSGPLHFANNDYVKKDDHVYMDLDLSSAYPTWLLNYKRGNFNYYVGGEKEYFQGIDYFKYFKGKDEYVKSFRIGFAVKTKNAQTSKLYRKWILKTTKIRGLIMSKTDIAGVITIPDIQNMPNRFLELAQGYDDYEVEILGTITTAGTNSVYINEDNLSKFIKIKNSNHIDNDLAKEVLNTSTGYLSISDKVLYYVMINHIKSKVFDLIDYIDKWNVKRPEERIEIVAANTDGITVYAHKDLDLTIESFLEFEFNYKDCFTFKLKNIYTEQEAHFTKNDVKRRN